MIRFDMAEILRFYDFGFGWKMPIRAFLASFGTQYGEGCSCVDPCELILTFPVILPWWHFHENQSRNDNADTQTDARENFIVCLLLCCKYGKNK